MSGNRRCLPSYLAFSSRGRSVARWPCKTRLIVEAPYRYLSCRPFSHLQSRRRLSGPKRIGTTPVQTKVFPAGAVTVADDVESPQTYSPEHARCGSLSKSFDNAC